jgi:Na+-driven multidrug efflux pump
MTGLQPYSRGEAILLQLQNFTAYGLDGFVHAIEVLAGNALGNHGLWLAFTVLMIARAASLGLLYPRLERSVASKEVEG